MKKPWKNKEDSQLPKPLAVLRGKEENDLDQTILIPVLPKSSYSETDETSYFDLKIEDISINGRKVWDLSNGSDQQKFSRGVAFLEFFHRVHIGPECIAAAFQTEGASAPVGVWRALTILHEACKQFAATNDLLREIIECEESIPKIDEEIGFYVEIRLENTVDARKRDALAERLRERILKLDSLTINEQLNLPVETVKNVSATFVR